MPAETRVPEVLTRVNAGGHPPAGPMAWVSRWSADVTERLAGAGPTVVAVAVAALAVIALAVARPGSRPAAAAPAPKVDRHRPRSRARRYDRRVRTA